MSTAVIERDNFNNKEAWKQTRQQSYMIYLVNRDPKVALKSLEEFMPIDTKPKVIKKPTQKFIQEAAAKLEARLNKL